MMTLTWQVTVQCPMTTGRISRGKAFLAFWCLGYENLGRAQEHAELLQIPGTKGCQLDEERYQSGIKAPDLFYIEWTEDMRTGDVILH